MKMWRVIAFVVVLVLTGVVGLAVAETPQDTSAQPQAGQSTEMKGPKRKSRQNPEERLKRMTKQLQLTDQQQEQIKPILMEEAEQIKGLKADKTLTRQQRIDKMREIRDANHDKIKALLNPDQQQKLDQMKEKAASMRQKKQEQQPAQAPAATQK